MKHILSTDEFLDRRKLEDIFALAADCEQYKRGRHKLLSGIVLGSIYYEESTRTRWSFDLAALRAGAHFDFTENARKFSSAIKGESLGDHIRVMSGMVDVIVLRHDEQGAAQRAAPRSLVPLINGGDGPGDHPTQGLLDMYTIWKELGTIDHLTVRIVGDLRFGRTVHALVNLLSLGKGNRIILHSPSEFELPTEYWDSSPGITMEEWTDPPSQDDLSKTDVLYMTRFQTNRYEDGDDELKTLYKRYRKWFVLKREDLLALHKHGIVMHPLPRGPEIPEEIIESTDPRIAFFRQSDNGVPLRIALLRYVLDR